MYNHSHFLFQTITRGSLKRHAVKQHELRSIVIRKVCEVTSIDYIKQPMQENAWRKGNEVGVLIPLSDCNYIQEVRNSDHFADIGFLI